MKPRHLIETEGHRFFEPGIANFRDELVALRGILDIPPDLDPVEWVEEHFKLSSETTGELQPFRLYGYQKGILASMCDPTISELAVPKATRTGVTQIAMAASGYAMRHKRGTVMLVQPTEAKAQKFANDYLAPAFRDSPPDEGDPALPQEGRAPGHLGQPALPQRLAHHPGLGRVRRHLPRRDGQLALRRRGRRRRLAADQHQEPGRQVQAVQGSRQDAKERAPDPLVVAAAAQDEPDLAAVGAVRQAVLLRAVPGLRAPPTPALGRQGR